MFRIKKIYLLFILYYIYIIYIISFILGWNILKKYVYHKTYLRFITCLIRENDSNKLQYYTAFSRIRKSRTWITLSWTTIVVNVLSWRLPVTSMSTWLSCNKIKSIWFSFMVKKNVKQVFLVGCVKIEW